jgi:hypothetical protein
MLIKKSYKSIFFSSLFFCLALEASASERPVRNFGENAYSHSGYRGDKNDFNPRIDRPEAGDDHRRKQSNLARESRDKSVKEHDHKGYARAKDDSIPNQAVNGGPQTIVSTANGSASVGGSSSGSDDNLTKAEKKAQEKLKENFEELVEHNTDKNGTVILKDSQAAASIIVPGSPEAAMIGSTGLMMYSIRRSMGGRIASLSAMLDYDCKIFGSKNFCSSVLMRHSLHNHNNLEVASSLVLSYKISAKFRLGAFVDQRFYQLGGLTANIKSGYPSVGVFLGFNQDENGQGLQGKISVAYSRNGIGLTRRGNFNQVLGQGASILTSYAIGGEFGWGTKITDRLLVVPFIGFTWYKADLSSYSELSTNGGPSIRIFPYKHNALNLLFGLNLEQRLTDKLDLQIKVAGEYNSSFKTSNLAVRSSLPGLSSFMLTNTSPAKRLRSSGNVSLSYRTSDKKIVSLKFGWKPIPFANQNDVRAIVGLTQGF